MRSFDFIVSVIGDTDDDWNIKMEKIVVEKFGKLKCEDRILWQCREQVVTFRIETNGTSCVLIYHYMTPLSTLLTAGAQDTHLSGEEKLRNST